MKNIFVGNLSFNTGEDELRQLWSNPGSGADLRRIGIEVPQQLGALFLMDGEEIDRITHDTAYGRIRVHCPLRGTGDTAACHRLMTYDRALLAPHGGRLVVLRSQAEPGVTECEVAIRALDLPDSDLVPAHRRSPPAQ